MTPQEANALLTYTATLDNFVSDSDATLDVWAYTLAGLDLEQARYVVRDYYARQQPHERRPITPAFIRSKVHEEVHRAAAKRAALSAKPDSKTPTIGSWRARNPAEWDRLVREGRHDLWDDWNRRGIADKPCGCGCGSRPSRAP